MMENYFKDGFEKREFIGFNALLDLKKIYPEIFKWEISKMPEGKAFDAHYFVYDEEKQMIKKRVWIEIKIRDKVYPDYIFEKKKWDGMEKYRKDVYLDPNEVIYLYVNFTPEGTFIWNVSNMEGKKIHTEEYNEATENSRTEKKTKKVWKMEKSEAKKLDYVLNERRILMEWEQKYLVPKVKEKVKKYPCLLDILFGDGELNCGGEGEEKKD